MVIASIRSRQMVMLITDAQNAIGDGYAAFHKWNHPADPPKEQSLSSASTRAQVSERQGSDCYIYSIAQKKSKKQ